MKICALNNYPLDKMWRMSAEGRIPGQHAWGVDALDQAGHTVMIAPFQEPEERGPLANLADRSGYLLGQLDQELFSLRKRADIFYSACQTSARGLALSRRLHGRPTVSVLHHPVTLSRVNRAVLARYDKLVCLSERVLTELPRPVRGRASVLPWGPDLASPLYAAGGDDLGVLSAGKSNRDVETLLRALSVTGQAARVYDLTYSLKSAPDAVTLVRPGGAGMDATTGSTYLATQVLSDIARASIVAIPISNPYRLTGLTEINDALALGKPIIATRSPYSPIDVEAIGCGLSVDPGDVEGWVAALRTLDDASVRAAFGSRGREFAETGWNYEAFGTGLVALFG